MDKFKPGDVIVFLKDIIAGYEREHELLIPAFKPCKIVKLNSAHIWVEFNGTMERLRYIESRMAPAGELAKAIYG